MELSDVQLTAQPDACDGSRCAGCTEGGVAALCRRPGSLKVDHDPDMGQSVFAKQAMNRVQLMIAQLLHCFLAFDVAQLLSKGRR